jgi:hypothetical protein
LWSGCKRINYIDNTVDPTHDYIININSGEYEEWKLTSRNSIIRNLRGNSKESTIITIINKDEYTNPIFYIPSTCLHSTFIISSITFIINTKYLMISIGGEGGNIEMKDIEIKMKNEETILENNLIQFNKGSFFKITNVKFNKITLRISLIKIKDGNIYISNCEFKNIEMIIINEKDNGEGGIFYFSIDNLNIVEIRNECLFENCTVNTKNISNGGVSDIHRFEARVLLCLEWNNI